MLTPTVPRRLSRVAGLAVAAALLAACAGPPASAPSASSASGASAASASASAAPPSASSSAPTASPTTQTFTSPLFGYSIELPGDWHARPATRPWEAADGIHQLEIHTDWLVAPMSGPYISAMAQPVAPETDLEAWAAEMKALTDSYEQDGLCEPIDDSGDMRVAGEDARWASSPGCGGDRSNYVMWLFIVHDGDGHYFAWHSDASDPVGGKQAFEAMLATLEFPD